MFNFWSKMSISTSSSPMMANPILVLTTLVKFTLLLNVCKVIYLHFHLISTVTFVKYYSYYQKKYQAQRDGVMCLPMVAQWKCERQSLSPGLFGQKSPNILSIIPHCQEKYKTWDKSLCLPVSKLRGLGSVISKVPFGSGLPYSLVFCLAKRSPVFSHNVS